MRRARLKRQGFDGSGAARTAQHELTAHRRWRWRRDHARRAREWPDPQRLIELLRVIDHAVLEHHADAAHGADVPGRIVGHQEEIGSLAALETAVALVAPEVVIAPVGRDAQHL